MQNISTCSFVKKDKVVISVTSNIAPLGIGIVTEVFPELDLVSVDFSGEHLSVHFNDLSFYTPVYPKNEANIIDCAGRYYEVPSAEPDFDNYEDEDGWQTEETWAENLPIVWTEF